MENNNQLTPPPPENRLKSLLIMVGASLVISMSVLFLITKKGANPFDRLFHSIRSQDIQKEITEYHFSNILLPSQFQMVRVYPGLFEMKKVVLFLAKSITDKGNVASDYLTAFNFKLYKDPLILLVGLNGSGTNSTTMFNILTAQVHEPTSTFQIQDKVWISEKELPILISETFKNTLDYITIISSFSDEAVMVAVIQKKYYNDELARQIIASVYQTTSTAVSLVRPDTEAKKVAKQIVDGSGLDRKQAIEKLSNMGEPLDQAIEYLSEALGNSTSKEVKIDILNSLGILSRKNIQGLSPLLSSLKDNSIRGESIRVLGELGPVAKDMKSVLEKIALDRSESLSIQKVAKKALLQIEGNYRPSNQITITGGKKKKRK